MFLLFYQSPLLSKSNNLNDFDSGNISKYFSGIVAFENKEEDGDWRVKDNMGRIWYVDPKNLTDLQVALSRES